MAETWSKPVFSEMVAEIGYDADAHDMIVTWRKGGRRSAYNGVSEELAFTVAQAASVGQMINSEIKPFYPHRYV